MRSIYIFWRVRQEGRKEGPLHKEGLSPVDETGNQV